MPNLICSFTRENQVANMGIKYISFPIKDALLLGFEHIHVIEVRLGLVF
jgi:hypothetical protein